MVESSISAVLLCASFSLIFWNGLIHRKLTRVRRSFYTGWLYFQDAPYLSCAIQVAWLAASGYLLWSGTEEYAPAQLLDSFNGQMYMASFALFFLFIGIEVLLNQNLEKINTHELQFFVFADFALWVIFFVIAYADGTIWASTWPSTRIVGFILILSYPFIQPWAPFVQLQVYVNSQEASSSNDRVYSTVSSPRNDVRNRLSY